MANHREGFVLILSLLFTASSTALAQVPATQTKSGFIRTSDGVRLHYLESGSGPSIVFVPGWTMPAEIWEPQIRHFSHSYRVVALDPRSQGESQKVTEGHYPERRAQDVKELIEHLNLAPAVVVSWSMGVPELLSYVDQFGTSTLRALVLVDGYIGDEPKLDEIQQVFGFFQQIHSNRKQMLQQFMSYMFHKPQPPDYIQKVTDASLKTPTNTALALLAGMMGRDWRLVLPKLDKPMLYVITNPLKTQGEMLKGKIPTARVEVFQEAGHALFVDEPERFNRLLEEFLQSAQ